MPGKEFRDTMEYIGILNGKGILVHAEDGQLKIRVKKGVVLEDSLKEEIIARKEELLAYFTEYNVAGPLHATAGIRPREVAQSKKLPLSLFQEQLWLLDRLQGSTAYHLPAVLRLKGCLQKEGLEWAIKQIIQRHEILRTVIQEGEESMPVQEVLKEGHWKMEYVTAPELADIEALGRYLKEIVNAPFILSQDSLVRTRLIEIGDRESVLVVVMHHIVSDGWSFGVMVRELVELYRAYCERRPHTLPALPVQYADYALWQHQYRQQGTMEDHRQYWKRQLNGTEPLNLPVEHERPMVQSSRGSQLYVTIEKPLYEQLIALAQQERVTLFMLLLTVFKILLFRYTGQQDIAVGTSIANRRQQVIEPLIGFFTNLLVMRSAIDAKTTFNELLKAVAGTAREAYVHQDIPFEEVVRSVLTTRDRSRHPLFQALLVLQHAPEAMIDLGGVELTQEFFDYGTAQYDLMFDATETADGIRLRIEYCTDLFQVAVISRMASHYQHLLAAVVANPQEMIGRLSMLSDQEKTQLLIRFNDNSKPFPREKGIAQLFEEQVARTPGATAVIYRDTILTYAELNEQASRLAVHLNQHFHIGKGDVVGIMVDRSSTLIVCILGVLKAGAAYLPVSTHYPGELLRGIFEESAAKLLILDSGSLFNNDFYQGPVFAPDIQLAALKEQLEVPTNMAAGHDLAYIMYTSGSTGRPKGVMVEHRNVVSLIYGAGFVEFDGEDVLLSTGAPSFDAVTFEYWGMLLTGGTLVMCEEIDLLEPAVLQQLIRRHKITMMWFTAGLFNQLVDADLDIFDGLKTILAGGDKLSPIHVKQVKKRYPAVKLINGYGPTENTTFSLTCCIKGDEKDIPIGRPLNNRSAYVLNQAGGLCPVGVAGELCVGGEGLSKGYVKDEALTREKFVPHPFKKGERLYRTGDMARWQPDGQIAFLGRRDNQVKIRGYRIELGSIENVLGLCDHVSQCVVIARGEKDASRQLVAYIVPMGKMNRSRILDFLKSRLPEYMVPAVLVELPALPLTHNGKVDRNALPDIEEEEIDLAVYKGPRNETEASMAAIWQEVLAGRQIGITDNFFHAGGDSIKAIRVISQLKKLGYTGLKVADLFEHNTIEALALHASKSNDQGERQDWLNEIARDMTALREEVLREMGDPDNIEDVYPMSDIQKGMVFASLQSIGEGVYHDQMVYQANYPDFDKERFEKALALMVHKHPILRTGFNIGDFREEVQLVLKNMPASVEHIELLSQSREQQENFIRQYLATELKQPFDVEKAPLWRATVFRISAHDIVFVFQFHHAILDGWSMASLNTELNNLYLSLGHDAIYKPAALAATPRDAIMESLADKKDDSLTAFWKEEMTGYKRLELFTDKPAGTRFLHQYDAAFLAKLAQAAKESQVTLKSLLLGAFLYALKRYTQDNEVTVGTVTNLRPEQQEDGDKVLGCYLNTIPFRFTTDDLETLTWKEYGRKVEEKGQQLKKKERLTLPEITKLAGGKPGEENPFFDVLFNFIDFHIYNDLQQYSASAEEPPLSIVSSETTNTLLDLNVSTTGGRLSFSYGLRYQLKADCSLEKIHQWVHKALENFIHHNTDTIGPVGLATSHAGLLESLINSFNDTAVDYPAGETVVDLLAEQVARTPGEIAVVHDQKCLTFQELDQYSNQLAHYLLKVNVRENSLVAICMERRPEMVIAVLGILKAGGTYVPVDPAYPPERMAYLFEDTGSNIVLTSHRCRSLLPAKGPAIILEMDNHREWLSQEPVTAFGNVRDAHSLTYILYTSGSTGRPKGVLMQDSALCNLLRWQQDQYGLGGKRVLQFASLNFDVSFQELFSVLCFGGSIHLIDDERRKDMGQLLQVISEQNITQLFVPYVVLKGISEQAAFEQLYPASLQYIFTAGEQLRLSEDIRQLCKNTGAKLVNQYGPTETHIASHYEVTEKDFEQQPLPPIGRPVSNTQLYVVDKKGTLCSIGVWGELYIGGAQVARGYHNRVELTAEKFIPDIYQEKGEGRTLYRSGDICRWRADGNIEFAGRADDQVKIRGYRVELGEVETVLQQSGLVKQCVVLPVAGPDGHKQLIGYIVPVNEFDRQGIVEYARAQLPEYMVPAVLAHLEALPVNNNGKVDRSRLPAVEWQSPQWQYEAPRTGVEQVLCNSWQAVLKKEKIGIHDNFFELGGHSLLATRMIFSIRKALQVELTIRELFLYPTIAALAAHLSKERNDLLLPAIEKRERPELIPLSFSQERLWFIDRLQGSIQYHMPVVLQLTGHLDLVLLENVFRTVVRRHEALRTVFREETGLPYQYLLEEANWSLDSTDTTVYTPGNPSFQEKVMTLINLPFDLAADYLLRAHLLKYSEGHILILNLHHIASDGWSMPVLVRELSWLYNAGLRGVAGQLPALPVQYADYALWQRRYLSGAVLEQQLAYWQEQLAGLGVLELPTDKMRPAVQSTRGRVQHFVIGEGLHKRLAALSQQQGVTLYMTLLSALKILLHRYSGQRDIAVGSPIANRRQQETEGLIGFFVNTLVLRSQVDPGASYTELLRQVKATTLSAYEHQDTPFEKLVELLSAERDMSRSPLFQVLFVLQNNEAAIVEEGLLGDLTFQTMPVVHQTSKFDLTFSLQEQQSGLALGVEYCTDLYEDSTIERLYRHYHQLLESIVAGPGSRIADLQMLPLAEEEQLLKTFNDTAVEYGGVQSIPGLLAGQAIRTPDAVAVVYGQERLSYRALDERGNQVARCLQRSGVVPGSPVGVCLERSLELVIAIVGILKSGGAYVPIDPAYPLERIHYMLTDTGVSVVVSGEGCRDLISHPRVNIVTVSASCQESLEPVEVPYDASQPGYIIYTSGSTGHPKGVSMPCGSLVNLLLWHEQQYGRSHKQVLQFASINFDASFQELFSVLCFGGTVHLVGEEDRKDMGRLLEIIQSGAISDLFIPYIVLKNLGEQASRLDRYPGSLELIFTAGEQLRLSDDIHQLCRRTGCRLVNYYGPSETHVVSSYEVLESDYEDHVLPPIGRPVSNTQLYILDGEGSLCGIGIWGELYIGGVQVAAGYWGKEELTAARFVEDVYSERAGAKLYRSGDICRWRGDGNLEFLGRRDHQVKIRGYRVELGEVEQALQQASGVKQCVVVAQADPHGSNRLIAYVVGDIDKLVVLGELKSRLPEYMVPSLLVELDGLPVTSNGKVDRGRLPGVGTLAHRPAYEGARTATEGVLVRIWEEVLKLEGISIHDNFFELGGHSLLATRVVSAIRKELQTELAIRDLFLHPSIAGLSVRLVGQDRGLLLPGLGSVERPALLPVSFSQERLWFIDRLQGSVQYHLPMVLRLEGHLDTRALEQGFRRVIDRHEILRTVLIEEDGQLCQRVQEQTAWKLGHKKGTNNQDPDAVKHWVQTLINEPFDLSKDSMLRAHWLQQEEEQYILVIVLHHIVADGWSMPLLIKELVQYYKAYTSGQELQLPDLPVQYADYAIWQRSCLQGAAYQKMLAYWQQQLAGLEPLQLPADKPRPQVQSLRGNAIQYRVEEELLISLRELSQQQGITLFMTLLSVFKVLLYRYSGQEDIAVGSPVAGRTQKETEGLIGLFVNTLVLRSTIDPGKPFTTFLQSVKETTLSAYEHQDMPFEKIVEAVEQDRSLSYSPLFQVMFALQNNEGIQDQEEAFGAVKITSGSLDQKTARFDLTFSIQEQEKGLEVNIEYCTDLYEASTIERMFWHYRQLLYAVVADPEARIGALPMLSEAEQKQLLEEFNNARVQYSAGETILHQFEQQVLQNPDSIAVTFEKRSFTYQQLQECSNQLAHYLRQVGVGLETLVPVCMDRSLEMAVAVLGIMKAGGAYIPVDPAYPAQRIGYILEEAGAALAISNTTFRDRLAAISPGTRIIALDGEEGAMIHKTTKEKLVMPVAGRNLAYVIYTSGSTGKPKGVMIEHRGLMDLVLSHTLPFRLRKGIRVLQFASFSFDASCYEMFCTWCHGGHLILARQETLLHGPALQAFNEFHQIELAILPPSYLAALDTLPAFKTIVAGGEILPVATARQVIRQGIRLLNAYGPTENTICTTLSESPLLQNGKTTIGKPVGNVEVYMLDKSNNLLPVGVPGELCIGGTQLARGYLNSPELTAQKFVANPFRPGERMYRTGDLARWLPNGNIEYLGRMDHQVKIRGYRIELEEIESVIRQSGLVKQCALEVKEEEGKKQLIAFVVPAHPVGQEDILSYARDRLPEYMVPARLVQLDQLAVTVNGKIDHRHLLEYDLPVQRSYDTPGTATEQKVAVIWQSVLKKERIGIHDNFFEQGGHSLLATRVVSAVREELGIEPTIRDLFLYPTVAQFSAHLEKTGVSRLPPILPVARPAQIPLSFSQERLWFVDRLQGSVQYHIPAVLRLSGQLNTEMLEQSFRQVLHRHEILRTVVKETDGQPHQYIIGDSQWALGRMEADKDNQDWLQTTIADLIGQPFDLAADYMLRAQIIKLTEEEHILVLVLHHIASDGWSMHLLVQELTQLYQAGITSREADLPPLPVQYADYALWQRLALEGEIIEHQLSYWKEKLAGLTTLSLPTDKARPAVQSISGSRLIFEVEEDVKDRVLALSHQQGTTLFMTLLAVLKVLLYRYSGQQDIAIGSPIANRRYKETEGLIGFFINTLVLRSAIDPHASFLSLLAQVRETTLSAYEYQDAPFEKLAELLAGERNLGRSPLFQVLFVLQNNEEAIVQEDTLGNMKLEPVPVEQTTAKFDLTFSVQQQPDKLIIGIEYATDLYVPATIERMFGHFAQLLEAVIANPENSVGTLPMLSREETTQLLVGFNDSFVDYPREKTVVDLFEEQVKRRPEATALVVGVEVYSYKRLNENSNQLAHYLQSRGVGPERLVPVIMERGPHSIVALLAIMKAGGAFVPVDINYPPERIKYILEDTGSPICLTDRWVTEETGIDCINIKGDWESIIAGLPAENLKQHRAAPQHLVYVIYTSGSTGLPKGVQIEHRSLMDHVQGIIKYAELASCTSFGLFFPLSADAGHSLVFAALVLGASLHVISDQLITGGKELETYINHHAIDCIKVFPSLWLSYQESGYLPLARQVIIFGGESFPLTLIDRLNQAGYKGRIYNHYGPTETTIGKCLHRVELDNTYAAVPVGKPFSNSRVYIVDRYSQLQPIGVPGELCISGLGLARGYLNQPGLTAEKFVADPFHTGERMYRTGDLATRLPDGQIVYKGRIDDQVKIRGYRIEPGEISRVLEQVGGVRQAVVIARVGASDIPALMAYIVMEPGAAFDHDLLRAALRRQLPEYMIPSWLMEIPQVPLLSSGKVDKKRLPEPDLAARRHTSYQAPANTTEEKLAMIWQHLLKVEKIGIHDNFFELGGHSLLLMRVAAAINKEFDLKLPIVVLFRFITISSLAKCIELALNTAAKPETEAADFEIVNI